VKRYEQVPTFFTIVPLPLTNLKHCTLPLVHHRHDLLPCRCLPPPFAEHPPPPSYDNVKFRNVGLCLIKADSQPAFLVLSPFFLDWSVTFAPFFSPCSQPPPFATTQRGFLRPLRVDAITHPPPFASTFRTCLFSFPFFPRGEQVTCSQGFKPDPASFTHSFPE